MSVRDRLVAAFEKGNQAMIIELGWWPVLEAAATWWAPRQTCTTREFLPYVKLLGDEDPNKVLEAFEALTGEWRPTAAMIKGYLNAKRRADECPDTGRGCDRAGTPEATAAAAAALTAGDSGCSCPARPSTWTVDDRGVARCPRCRGIDWRQVYAAEDTGLIREAA